MGSSPPLAYRLVLGQALRSYRERLALEPSQVADKLGWYQRKVNLIETGQRKLVPAEVDHLVELYRLTEAEEQHLRELAREARKRDTTTPPVAAWAQTYVAMEAAATELRTFHEELVPGFAQTEEYARELLSHGILAPERGVDDAISRRLARQRHIASSDGPRLTMVLSESALRRQAGGPDVLRGQCEFLRWFARLPHISLRILPFETGAHTALGISFSLLRVSESTFAYTETFFDSHWYDRPPQTENYLIAFDRVHRSSLSEEETLTFLKQIN